MKSIILAILSVSIGFNIFLNLNNTDLRTQLALQTNRAEAYATLLDKNDAVQIQRENIEKVIQKRNRHVPEVIVSNWARTIQDASNVYNIDPFILLSLYKIESAMVHYDSRGNITVSSKGAGGLGQIMSFWYRACPHSNQPSDLNNGSVNIMCSAFILRHYLDENDNNMFLALTAYNSGPRGVSLMKRGKDITQKYAVKILTNYRETGIRML